MYSAVVDAISSTQPTDLLEINCAPDAVVILHEVHITQDASETSEQLPFQIHRASTSGSGGAALTANPVSLGDAAFGGNCERMNTSRGTEVQIVARISENMLNGVHWVFTPETRPVVAPNGRLIIGLETAPSASLTMSLTALFEEIGGSAS
jgi:hypothetical protein